MLGAIVMYRQFTCSSIVEYPIQQKLSIFHGHSNKNLHLTRISIAQIDFW